MKELTILTKHTGELSYTKKSPVAEVVSVSGDVVTARKPNGETMTVNLNEQEQALVSSSMWQKTTVDKWAVETVEVPSWATANEYVASTTFRVKYRYFKGFGGDPEWDERTIRWVMELKDGRKLAAVTLLNTKNFRSSFRQSLRDQLEKWLNTDPSDRQYGSPFSFRQWSCLVNSRLERKAKNLSESLYRDRNGS